MIKTLKRNYKDLGEKVEVRNARKDDYNKKLCYASQTIDTIVYKFPYYLDEDKAKAFFHSKIKQKRLYVIIN